MFWLTTSSLAAMYSSFSVGFIDVLQASVGAVWAGQSTQSQLEAGFIDASLLTSKH
jgi:hypothetical protein